VASWASLWNGTEAVWANCVLADPPLGWLRANNKLLRRLRRSAARALSFLQLELVLKWIGRGRSAAARDRRQGEGEGHLAHWQGERAWPACSALALAPRPAFAQPSRVLQVARDPPLAGTARLSSSGSQCGGTAGQRPPASASALRRLTAALRLRLVRRATPEADRDADGQT